MGEPSKPKPPAVPPRITPKVIVVKEGGSGGEKR